MLSTLSVGLTEATESFISLLCVLFLFHIFMYLLSKHWKKLIERK